VITDKTGLYRRASRIRLLLTDCDGVLTDTGVYYSEHGEELKRFSIRDGMGVACLREAGIETGIITGEFSHPLVRRAEQLNISLLYQGARDKKAVLQLIMDSLRYAPEQVAYIGDDINDIPVITALQGAGLTAAPGDALPIVAQLVHCQCTATGEKGALREFADWLLALRCVESTHGNAPAVYPSFGTPQKPAHSTIHGEQRVQASGTRR